MCKDPFASKSKAETDDKPVVEETTGREETSRERRVKASIRRSKRYGNKITTMSPLVTKCKEIAENVLYKTDYKIILITKHVNGVLSYDYMVMTREDSDSYFVITLAFTGTKSLSLNEAIDILKRQQYLVVPGVTVNDIAEKEISAHLETLGYKDPVLVSSTYINEPEGLSDALELGASVLDAYDETESGVYTLDSLIKEDLNDGGNTISFSFPVSDIETETELRRADWVASVNIPINADVYDDKDSKGLANTGTSTAKCIEVYGYVNVIPRVTDKEYTLVPCIIISHIDTNFPTPYHGALAIYIASILATNGGWVTSLAALTTRGVNPGILNTVLGDNQALDLLDKSLTIDEIKADIADMITGKPIVAFESHTGINEIMCGANVVLYGDEDFYRTNKNSRYEGSLITNKGTKVATSNIDLITVLQLAQKHKDRDEIILEYLHNLMFDTSDIDKLEIIKRLKRDLEIVSIVETAFIYGDAMESIIKVFDGAIGEIEGDAIYGRGKGYSVMQGDIDRYTIERRARVTQTSRGRRGRFSYKRRSTLRRGR